MEKENIRELITGAEAAYEIALREYNKPMEDLVMYSTCHVIEKAIVNFLDAFLVSHNEIPLYGKDILSLQKRCIELDSQFKNLDYSLVPSLQAGMNDVSKLPGYIKVLEATRELVKQQLSKIIA